MMRLPLLVTCCLIFAGVGCLQAVNEVAGTGGGTGGVSGSSTGASSATGTGGTGGLCAQLSTFTQNLSSQFVGCNLPAGLLVSPHRCGLIEATCSTADQGRIESFLSCVSTIPSVDCTANPSALLTVGLALTACYQSDLAAISSTCRKALQGGGTSGTTGSFGSSSTTGGFGTGGFGTGGYGTGGYGTGGYGTGGYDTGGYDTGGYDTGGFGTGGYGTGGYGTGGSNDMVVCAALVASVDGLATNFPGCSAVAQAPPLTLSSCDGALLACSPADVTILDQVSTCLSSLSPVNCTQNPQENQLVSGELVQCGSQTQGLSQPCQQALNMSTPPDGGVDGGPLGPSGVQVCSDLTSAVTSLSNDTGCGLQIAWSQSTCDSMVGACSATDLIAADNNALCLQQLPAVDCSATPQARQQLYMGIGQCATLATSVSTQCQSALQQNANGSTGGNGNGGGVGGGGGG